ncbi:MAG: toxin-antitoxin system YwqK family antitoxin [Alphaproteobacteria bacterium]|nr:toxin-antitoxin system YwqK family antitoxin [Alphaproteobacteria bacterium]
MDQSGIAPEPLSQTPPENDSAPTVPNGIVESHDDKGVLTQRATYSEGVLEGEFLVFNPQGTIIQKFFYHEGKLKGEAFIYNDDGQLGQKLTYDGGVLNGPHQTFANNVLVVELPFVQGLREGVARFFAPNGGLQAEITFKKDKENGLRTIYNPELGVVVRKEILIEGALEGKSQTFYPSGALMIEQLYEKGLLQGRCVQFYEDGTTQQESNYDKGVLTEPAKNYDQNGKEL